ncbi:tyrosine protein kinase, putative [Entamoeba invadens IP1]|uniref:Tyrosine protein kinase, putative n=1 Tax=Entamoeba invadens IP1 TaxID=370355 RepID=L7FKJ2_ENTIV|nr:tyrosine protein kinase, putative [Entamoeba invadens IP1]ELP85467.1 tyrosine protein kinase, putative [Entamoeba invadens IP1]|eukprot:XP_004184813.1 tyrosine protein kinase, putative [Entamoeba invadens IP1]
MTLPSGGGCAICNEGYYKEGTDCISCDVSCSLCNDRISCSECNQSYYRLYNSLSKLCLPYESLTNCINKTSSGCLKCSEGYYLEDSTCVECEENCISCQNINNCAKCVTSDYVLVNFKCVYYSQIDYCTSAKDSKCTSCENNNKPTNTGESCEGYKNYSVAIGVPVAVTIVLLLLIISIIIVVIVLVQRKKLEKKERNICTFDMSHSNIQMSKLKDDLVANKKKLTFDLDSDELIPVDAETRDLICIGNTSKHTIKIQFSVMDGCDFYKIRTEPSIVILKRNFACEFEVFINPLCSSIIHENVIVTALDISTGIIDDVKIEVEVETQTTTKLNYRDIEETKKLGEGSFGIVYKGIYRGNIVAIKKMKQIENKEDGLVEFEKEVSMLDKFRSEYIVHFYGAVFVPNKICMVTEFAQFGSLQDLMKNKTAEEVNMKLRNKFVLDGARGISYLHTNGILHRDIKPDNFLIVSIEMDDIVNAKLTDFGSSRNVNLLTTNMTFTKGIGTPVYMAPEVLRQEKYKKAADVYSFGITMYEVFGWKEAYNKNSFKFPWKIAEFVIAGSRLSKRDMMSDEQYLIINNCWKQNSIDRITIENVVTKLENLN